MVEVLNRVIRFGEECPVLPSAVKVGANLNTCQSRRIEYFAPSHITEFLSAVSYEEVASIGSERDAGDTESPFPVDDTTDVLSGLVAETGIERGACAIETSQTAYGLLDWRTVGSEVESDREVAADI